MPASERKVEHTGKRLHILLIEDNPGDASAVQEALDALKAPADLAVVGNGYAGLDYLFRQSPYESAPTPDIVLIDLNLPGLHGRQVLAAIRGDPRLLAVPVAIYTSTWAPETVADCRRLADAYIVKPRNWSECVDRIRDVLRQLGRLDGQAQASGVV